MSSNLKICDICGKVIPSGKEVFVEVGSYKNWRCQNHLDAYCSDLPNPTKEEIQDVLFHNTVCMIEENVNNIKGKIKVLKRKIDGITEDLRWTVNEEDIEDLNEKWANLGEELGMEEMNLQQLEKQLGDLDTE